MRNNKKNNIGIAIIDSGIDSKRKEFKDVEIHFFNNNDDNIGHGTAVASIISQINKDSVIYSYNLFAGNGLVDGYELINALKIISNEKNIDIIHMSCGVTDTSCLDELYEVCKRISEEGTIIVAAFDNEGAISYPAAFDCVIGVDWTKYCVDGMSYIFVKNSIVNIYGIGSLQYLPWKNNTYKYVAGSSFAAPYITGKIVKLLRKGIEPDDIYVELEKEAIEVVEIDNAMYCPQDYEIRIQSAITFPFNKEIATMLCFENKLPFKIYGVYDLPIFRKIGKKCKDITDYGNSTQIIKSFKEIDWNAEFDTVILGHLDVIIKAVGQSFLNDILEKCIIHKKNIYSFDDLWTYNENIKKILKNGNFVYTPETSKKDVDKSTLGKLYEINTPVVAVFGTSSKQGKFSLQLELRRKLQDVGYKVGGLGTEPTSLLCGMDRVYPIGYQGKFVYGHDAVKIVNRYMWEIDKKNYDIIITGSQSLSVPHNFTNISHYPIAQHEFLIGVNPDAIIVCINPFDEVEYIRRTISYLESYSSSKVVALVMYQKDMIAECEVDAVMYKIINTESLFERCCFYKSKLQLPCLVSGIEEQLDSLLEIIIEYLSEE